MNETSRRIAAHEVTGVRCPGSGQLPRPEPSEEEEESQGPAAEPARLFGERQAPKAAFEPGRLTRGWLIAVLAVVLLLVVGGLMNGRSEPPAAADASAEGDMDTSPSSPSAKVDTSVQDVIDAAGVSSALVRQLGQVASETGYGLNRGEPLPDDVARSFAAVQIGTCRDLASGYQTLEEMMAADVADGAAAADAQRMATFLRDTFCPAVKPLAHATSSQAPISSTPQTDGTRGLMSTAAFLDATFPSGSLAECAAATGQPFGEPRAYVLPGGQLLCGSSDPDGPWDGHFINFDVVFRTPVPVDQALPVITSLLPTDLARPDRRDGVNPPYAPTPGGCLSVVWTSPTVGAAVTRIDPEWDTDNEVGAVFYSDRQTPDGSSAAFDGTVHVASVGFGGHNDVSGPVIC